MKKVDGLIKNLKISQNFLVMIKKKKRLRFHLRVLVCGTKASVEEEYESFFV